MDKVQENERRFFTTATTLLSLTLFAITANLTAAIAKQLGQDFDLSEARLVQRVFPIQFTGFTILCFLGGAASDRWGKRLTLLASCLLVVIGSVVMTFASSLWCVYLGAVIIGMGGGILEPVASAGLTDLHPNKSKMFMNLSQVFYCAGAISVSTLVGIFTERGVSWPAFYIAIAILGFLMTIAFSISRFPKKISETTKSSVSWGTQFKQLLPVIWLPSLAVFLYVYSETSFYAFGPNYLKQLGASDFVSTLSIATFWGAVVIGRIACSFLPQKQSYEPIICVMFLFAGLAGLSLCFASSATSGLVCLGLTGLFCAGTWPLLVSLTASRNMKYSGTASGIVIGCGATGCVLSPLTLGAVFDQGRTTLAFMLLGGSFLLGMLCTIGIYFQYQRQLRRQATASDDK